ncbi:hypothetical protein Tco_1092033 [Tanacetum coccineum]|uniref:Uncharacterized protein n=1 Tax=Tanacetum coccineum TaxID=301880 RepID=A0ABQ5I8Q5_9ASTR
MVTTPAVPATEDSPEVPAKTSVETMKSTQLLMHVRQLKKCGKPSRGYNKQQHKLDEVSYHKLFDILKQYQKEVNELRAERMAKNANPLALPKPSPPPSESALEDSDPEQAQKDKDMQKNLALIAKYFKKLYKPTNNNLRTSSNTRNKNVDTNPRYKTDIRLTLGIKRPVNAVGKPKRVRDSTYHKEKMLLCKQAEKGVQLQAEQSDWLADTDEEIDEQELEAHYSYMAKIQEVPNADSGTDAEPLEQWKREIIMSIPEHTYMLIKIFRMTNIM